MHGPYNIKFALLTVLLTDPLNAELNPICHLITLRGGARYLGFSRLRVNFQVPLFHIQVLYYKAGHIFQNTAFSYILQFFDTLHKTVHLERLRIMGQYPVQCAIFTAIYVKLNFIQKPSMYIQYIYIIDIISICWVSSAYWQGLWQLTTIFCSTYPLQKTLKRRIID
jgi:hypothetical protein